LEYTRIIFSSLPANYFIRKPIGNEDLIKRIDEIINSVNIQIEVSKRILIIDDDPVITLTFKGGIENNNDNEGKRIEVHAYHNSMCINIDEPILH
jgi:hypothetical protein